MHPYTITLSPKAPFSETLLKEYEEAINEGLSGKGFRVRLEESELNDLRNRTLRSKSG